MELGWELLLFDSYQTSSFSWCSSPSSVSTFPIPTSLRSCLALWKEVLWSQPAPYVWLVQVSLSFPWLISFSPGLWLVIYVNIFLQELREDSPIRNTLIVPNWELLEQIRYILQLICLFLAHLIFAVWILCQKLKYFVTCCWKSITLSIKCVILSENEISFVWYSQFSRKSLYLFLSLWFMITLARYHLSIFTWAWCQVNAL